MENKILFKLVLIVFLLFGSNAIWAQTNFEIRDHSENSIEISGTSTSYDWTMETKTFIGDAQFNLEPGNDIIGLKKLKFLLPVLNLKSNKKGVNKSAYKALKTNQFKNIEYKLTSAKIIEKKRLYLSDYNCWEPDYCRNYKKSQHYYLLYGQQKWKYYLYG